MFHVADKVVFITGGTAGIGLASANRLAGAVVPIDGGLSTGLSYPLPGAVINSLEA